MEFENILQRLDYYAKAMSLNDNKITIDAGLSVGTLGKSRKGPCQAGKLQYPSQRKRRANFQYSGPGIRQSEHPH